MTTRTIPFVDVSDDTDLFHRGGAIPEGVFLGDGRAESIPDGAFLGDDQLPPIPPGVFHGEWTRRAGAGRRIKPPVTIPESPVPATARS